MKFIFSTVFAVLFLVQIALGSDHLHQVDHIKDVSAQEIAAELGINVPYGVAFYKMTYHTTGSDGLPDIASGLVVIPDVSGHDPSLIIYHHGTSIAPDRVPSSLNLDYEAYTYMGGMGFAVIAPDYLGMGESRGFHPYVHKTTLASASLDMLKAFYEWTDQGNGQVDEKLFITGYSQGGFAGMATHELLETHYGDVYPVTAAAHLSGPYSLSGVMRDLMFSEQNYDYPGFIPYAIIGFQEVYGDLYDDLSEIFRDIFVPPIASFSQGEINLAEVTLLMILLNQQEFGNRHPVNFFNPDLVQAMNENEDHYLNQLLFENDTYRWAPGAPTRIWYCDGDNMVPPQNSVVAAEAMIALGAWDLQWENLGSNLDHGDCAVPAILATVDFFNSFQETSIDAISQVPAITVYPNPASQHIHLQGIPDGAMLQILDLSGRVITEARHSGSLYVGHLARGAYLLRIQTSQWRHTEKIYLQ